MPLPPHDVSGPEFGGPASVLLARPLDNRRSTTGAGEDEECKDHQGGLPTAKRLHEA